MTQMKKKNLFSFLVLIIFLVSAFFLLSRSPKPISSEIQEVQIAGQTIKVELAKTPSARAQGLSGRQGLNDNEGLLFVFDQLGKYSFWMKDMNFPIDMIWLGENMQVVYIKKDARPELYPESYGSDENAKYVLEVVSGFAEKNNLKVGDVIEFTY